MREAVNGGEARPPRPTLALTLGVTGHRRLDGLDEPALAAALTALFARAATAVEAIAARHGAVFDDCPPALTLVSPLAAGADQLAAEVALARGWTLHAALPFARDDYVRDFDDPARARFDALLTRATSVWAAPEPRGAGSGGYVLAGEATVAQADVLVAIWDGGIARGPGGTAEVVDEAVRRGVPVVHLPTDPAVPAALLWAGFEEMNPELLRRDNLPRRPLDGPALEDVLAALLAPPGPAPEAALFLAERERRLRARTEWTLLLAVTGVQRPRRASLRASPYLEAARRDWAAYRAGADEACGPAAGSDALETAFAWADGLALHYANVYRSGMVLNFTGAATAVVLSLLATLFPAEKLALLMLELLAIGAVIVNTVRGTRREWHRRWLDYRFLAEQLRPLKSLKLLGIAGPPSRGRAGPRRWTDWYALAVWRGMGPPPAPAGAGGVQRLARHVAAHELDGQVGYHRAAAHRMHLLDHRLHRLGLVMFVATILIGLATLAGLLAGVKAVKHAAPVLGMLSAALPTLGAAIFGIRGAGDFAGTAGRSLETARRLERSAALLRRPDTNLATAARAAEEAANIMLADLAEWRSSYSHRKLAIPS